MSRRSISIKSRFPPSKLYSVTRPDPPFHFEDLLKSLRLAHEERKPEVLLGYHEQSPILIKNSATWEGFKTIAGADRNGDHVITLELFDSLQAAEHSIGLPEQASTAAPSVAAPASVMSVEDGYGVVDDSVSTRSAAPPAASTSSFPPTSMPGSFQSSSTSIPQSTSNHQSNSSPNDLHSLAQISLANCLSLVNSLSSQAISQANILRDQAQNQSMNFVGEQLNNAEHLANQRFQQHGPQVSAGIHEAMRRVDNAVQSANGLGEARGLDGILGGVQQILNHLIGGTQAEGGMPPTPQATSNMNAPESRNTSTQATAAQPTSTDEPQSNEEEPMSAYDRMMARNRSQGMALGNAFGQITARRAARLNPDREAETDAQEVVLAPQVPPQSQSQPFQLAPAPAPVPSTSNPSPAAISEEIRRTNEMLANSWMNRLQEMGHQSQPSPYGRKMQQQTQPQPPQDSPVDSTAAAAATSPAVEPAVAPATRSVEDTNEALGNAFEEMLARMRGGGNGSNSQAYGKGKGKDF